MSGRFAAVNIDLIDVLLDQPSACTAYTQKLAAITLHRAPGAISIARNMADFNRNLNCAYLGYL
jgi:hypothetical protein